MRCFRDKIIKGRCPEKGGIVLKKSITAIFICIFLTAAVIIGFYKAVFNEKSYRTKSFTAMDTAVSVTLWGKQFDDKLYNSIKRKIEDLDKLFDSYSEGGEVYKLNKKRHLACSEYTSDIVSKTLSIQNEYKNVDISSGKLISLWDFQSESPKVPMNQQISDSLKTISDDNIHINGNKISIEGNTNINLSAVAKGYACDIVKKRLIKSDIDCAVISFGSSTLLYGEKPDGNKFSVAVRNPKSKSGSYIGKLITKSCIISSSGGYERYFEADGKTYSHILDLKTGYPAQTDLTSVTVISQNGLLTDFLSTEIYIGGTENIGNYLNREDYSVIALSKDKKVYISENIKNSFEITDDKYSFK